MIFIASTEALDVGDIVRHSIGKSEENRKKFSLSKLFTYVSHIYLREGWKLFCPTGHTASKGTLSGSRTFIKNYEI
jgi:hypothetical protein